MLYLNDEKISLKDIRDYKGDDEVKKLLSEQLDEILSFKFPVVYRWKQGVRTFNKKAGLKEGKKAIWVPYNNIVESEAGDQVLRYCEQSFPTSRDGDRKYTPRGIWFRKNLTLDKSKMDLILFLEFHTPIVGRDNSKIEREDLEARAVTTHNERALEAQLWSHIYNPESVIYNDEAKLKGLARAWNVGGVNNMTNEQLRNAIFDAVKKGEIADKAKYGYAVFSKNVKKLNPQLEHLSLINEAIEKKIIEFKDNVKIPKWIWITDDGERDIMKVNPTEIKLAKEVLAGQLAIEPALLATLISTVEKGVGRKDVRTETEGNIERYKEAFKDNLELEGVNYNMMKKIGSEMGLSNLNTMKKDQLIEQIQKKLIE